jgi:hypothetical protein
VLSLLKRYNLDESAIEAMAIERLGSELESIARMLAALEGRRNRAMRALREGRQGFATKAHDVSQPIIEGNRAVQLEQLKQVL